MTGKYRFKDAEVMDVTYGHNAEVFAEYLWRSTKRKAHLKTKGKESTRDDASILTREYSTGELLWVVEIPT